MRSENAVEGLFSKKSSVSVSCNFLVVAPPLKSRAKEGTCEIWKIPDGQKLKILPQVHKNKVNAKNIVLLCC
jgi:hypothetical protein